MDKYGLLFAGMLAVVLVASVLSMIQSSGTLTANTVAAQPNPQNQPSFDEKTVVLAEKNYNYYFPDSGSDTITIKKGQKVTFDARLSGQDALAGCYKSIRTPWGTKVFKPGDTRFSFTPDQSGSFGFTCGMGMGKGTIVVEN